MRCLGIRFRRGSQENPDQLLRRARDGDDDARNQLIQDYAPFVLKVASQKAGRFLRPGVDEEISVALMAFNEAIDAYDGTRGSFVNFSHTVIQRRLVDYFRRSKGRQHEMMLSDLEASDDQQHESNLLNRAAHSVWGLREEQQARRLEIEEFNEILAKFGISFQELARVAPKHRDSRSRAISLARAVAHSREHRRVLVERGELPVKALIEEFKVSRALIERNRKYIIAVALVLIYDLPHLQGYVLER